MIIEIPKNKENNYGYIFHLFRLANNWTVEDIANKLGTDKNYIELIETSSIVRDMFFDKFSILYDVNLSTIKRIHDNSKNKYNWDYRKTMKDILDYYFDKAYFKENY